MKPDTRTTISGIRRSSSSWLWSAISSAFGSSSAKTGRARRVDLVALDRHDDRRDPDVTKQLPVRDRPVLDHPVDRSRQPVGVVVLPRRAVELEAPRCLDVLGHAGRVLQDGLQRLLGRLALEVLREEVVAGGEPEGQIEPGR
jgi:hypothetical protein